MPAKRRHGRAYGLVDGALGLFAEMAVVRVADQLQQREELAMHGYLALRKQTCRRVGEGAAVASKSRRFPSQHLTAAIDSSSS